MICNIDLTYVLIGLISYLLIYFIIKHRRKFVIKKPFKFVKERDVYAALLFSFCISPPSSVTHNVIYQIADFVWYFVVFLVWVNILREKELNDEI